MERGARARRGLAVPAAVFELFAEETIDERGATFPEIRPERDDGAVDARLRLTVKKRLIVANLPGQMVVHAFYDAARLRGRPGRAPCL